MSPPRREIYQRPLIFHEFDAATAIRHPKKLYDSPVNLKGAPPERFGSVSALFYRLWAEPTLAPLHRRVGAEVPIERGRLLDIGCGPGRLDRLLAATWPDLSVVGLDESPGMLRQAAKGPNPSNLEFRLGRLEDADFDETFDFALSVLSFHHWEDPEGGLAAAHRALRPGGRLWIYEPDPEAESSVLRSDYAPLWGFLSLPLWICRAGFRGHGFSQKEAEEVVRPAVERSSFGEMTVSRRGSTLRFELTKNGAR